MIGPHTHRDNPLSRIMCVPIAPPVTVFFSIPIRGKRGRTASDDAGGQSLSDTSTSARGQCVGESSTGVKSTVIRTSVNMFEASKRDKPQYFVDVLKDKRRTKNDNLEFLIG